MKKTSRAPWEGLGMALYDYGWSLCALCRYGESDGSSICDDDSYMQCNHPLPAISKDGPGEECFTAQCWGFRPEKGLGLAQAADEVGIILQGYYPARWVDGKLPTEQQIRLYPRLVVIGELTPWRYGNRP